MCNQVQVLLLVSTTKAKVGGWYIGSVFFVLQFFVAVVNVMIGINCQACRRYRSNGGSGLI